MGERGGWRERARESDRDRERQKMRAIGKQRERENQNHYKAYGFLNCNLSGVVIIEAHERHMRIRVPVVLDCPARHVRKHCPKTPCHK